MMKYTYVQLCICAVYNPNINVNPTQFCTTLKQSPLLGPLCLY